MLKFSYDKAIELNKAKDAENLLLSGNGKGNDFLGWLNLPINYDKEEFERIKKAAAKIRNTSDVLLVCGIGGSYLGARAAIEFLQGSLRNDISDLKIYFIGNNLSSEYISDILKICQDKEVSVNIISKSGTTLEPALSFRLIREFMKSKYGEKANERIYATTDKSKGVLKTIADKNGYETFIVPDDIGGRYSVLTAVGLLPIATAGADIDKILQGAKAEMQSEESLKYAAVRNELYNSDKKIEILASFEPSLTMICEWWKQLFGESEGKGHKGIYPASVQFTADLHSMGQYIQDGERSLFETVIKINNSKPLIINEDNEDGLDFINGKDVAHINELARQGVAKAHAIGNVPNLLVEIDKKDEEHLGRLIYFFEKACAISGYMLDVNPFDQPGVEEYKKQMYHLLEN